MNTKDTVRVFHRPDGGISICYPAWKLKPKDLSDELFLEFCLARATNGSNSGMAYEDIDKNDVPKERKYRNAWEKSVGNPIVVNAEKKAKIDNDALVAQEMKAREEKAAKEFKDKVISDLKKDGLLPPDYVGV